MLTLSLDLFLITLAVSMAQPSDQQLATTSFSRGQHGNQLQLFVQTEGCQCTRPGRHQEGMR